MKIEEIEKGFKKALGGRLKESRIESIAYNLKKKHVVERAWFKVEGAALHEAVEVLCRLFPQPHFSVCSGYDLGKTLEVLYHFTVDYGKPLEEKTVTFKVALPKANPTVETITDLVPGALISEREMQEMLGIKVKGIPDSRRLFLHEEFPKGVFPWRRDGKVEKMARLEDSDKS